MLVRVLMPKVQLHSVYSTSATLGKARRRIEKSLPESPRKNRVVLQELATKILGAPKVTHYTPSDSEIEGMVTDFYQEDSI